MARIKLKITATGTFFLQTENYQEQWDEENNEDGEEGVEPESTPVPDSYALEKFQEDIEEGNISLDEVLEIADIDVQQVS